MLRLDFGTYLGARELEVRAGPIMISLSRSLIDPEQLRCADHAHEDAHFMFVLDPGYRSAADGAPAESAAPLLLFNPAGTIHRDHFSVAGGRFLALTVPNALLAHAGSDVGMPEHAVSVEAAAAHDLARRIVGTVIGEASGPLQHLESLALELLGAATAGRAQASRAPPAWLRMSQTLLEDLIVGDSPTVTATAASLGVHPIYFARMFRRHFGCTPGQYARRARIDRAADLLRHSRQSISAVAAGLGYADQSHMNKDFRLRYGCTPGQYSAALRS